MGGTGAFSIDQPLEPFTQDQDETPTTVFICVVCMWRTDESNNQGSYRATFVLWHVRVIDCRSEDRLKKFVGKKYDQRKQMSAQGAKC